jgi:diadenosine tetraphosphate (Ap4A) HIT family hydrolase
MSKQCPFCDRPALEPRVFFERGKWCAFLGAPFIAKGHAVLAEKTAYVANITQRIDHGWDQDEQRGQITRQLSSYVEGLRLVTGYESA